ncbi:uncharacterized protein L969DRAFT_93427 [Mixia osmundae IAM 14324]|uniref:Protein PNS1 n=1 Tax=Mixia osmundae (strain CBS 9802 / IAM 14324 / JCM 22182 / KY 12970) TaxID=764103 RepID=G7EAS6_MIXOS|nr:uncharacterized protein L969DRAFT_93427 [Mixia osmundae IAM 14324]KEI40905.1 hypothetical protein L969DRAFT_93427 [Mixia osmundae IAM 14324]GAA99936.1 hypothetical protein E5Q_06639 [Mixia osmundae IAM 14324]
MDPQLFASIVPLILELHQAVQDGPDENERLHVAQLAQKLKAALIDATQQARDLPNGDLSIDEQKKILVALQAESTRPHDKAYANLTEVSPGKHEMFTVSVQSGVHATLAYEPRFTVLALIARKQTKASTIQVRLSYRNAMSVGTAERPFDTSMSQPYVQQPQQAYGQPPMMQAPNYAPTQGQPMQQQQNNYDQQQNNGYYGQAKQEEDEKFSPQKPKWNDLIFALLFLAQFGAFIALSVITLRTISSSGGNLTGGSTGVTFNRQTAYLFALIAPVGFVLAICFLAIVRAFTKIILEITLLLSVALSIGTAVYAFIEKQYSAGVIFALFALLAIISYPFMRKRIPLTVAILHTVFRAANAHPSTYVIAILGTLVQGIYSVWWSFTLAATYTKYSDGGTGCGTSGGSCGTASIVLAVMFLTFSYYWTTQAIAGIVLVTNAGIFGTWYFSAQGGVGKPVHIARGAFRRAITYSLGSIAEGTLIVAILQFLRTLVNLAESQARQDGDMIGMACGCIASCCLGCITWAVEYFNRYAMIEIALYGKKYSKAAKDAWNLLKHRGIDALINDSLIGNVWFFGSFGIGALCSLLIFLYLHLRSPSYIDASSGLTAAAMGFAWLIGFTLVHTLGQGTIQAGADTIFVAMAEAPLLLQQRSPELYEVVASRYGHILQGV